jgi:hypothetical protein
MYQYVTVTCYRNLLILSLLCSRVTTVVVGTVEDNAPNVSAKGPGDKYRSLSCVAVVTGYNKRYGAALAL